MGEQAAGTAAVERIDYSAAVSVPVGALPPEASAAAVDNGSADGQVVVMGAAAVDRASAASAEAAAVAADNDAAAAADVAVVAGNAAVA